jgi:hypothetical protein
VAIYVVLNQGTMVIAETTAHVSVNQIEETPVAATNAKDILTVLSVKQNQSPHSLEEGNSVRKWFDDFDRIKLHYEINWVVGGLPIPLKALNPLAHLTGHTQWWTTNYTRSYAKAERELKAIKQVPSIEELKNAWLNYFDEGIKINSDYLTACKSGTSNKNRWLKEKAPSERLKLDQLALKAITRDYQLRSNFGIPLRRSKDEENAADAFNSYKI